MAKKVCVKEVCGALNSAFCCEECGVANTCKKRCPMTSDKCQKCYIVKEEKDK